MKSKLDVHQRMAKCEQKEKQIKTVGLVLEILRFTIKIVAHRLLVTTLLLPANTGIPVF